MGFSFFGKNSCISPKKFYSMPKGSQKFFPKNAQENYETGGRLQNVLKEGNSNVLQSLVAEIYAKGLSTRNIKEILTNKDGVAKALLGRLPRVSGKNIQLSLAGTYQVLILLTFSLMQFANPCTCSEVPEKEFFVPGLF